MTQGRSIIRPAGHFRPAGRARVGLVAKGVAIIHPSPALPLPLRRKEYVKPVTPAAEESAVHFPPVPAHPRRSRPLSDVTRDPVAMGSLVAHRHRRRRLGAVTLGLATLVLVPLLSRHHGGSASAVGPSVVAPVSRSAGVVHASGLGPIVLPGPLGDAPRTRPLDMMIVIDPAVWADAADRRVLESELPVVARYVHTYGLRKDEIGSPLEGLKLASDSPAVLATAITTPGVAPRAAAALESRWWAARPRHDHAVVVITSPASARSWEAALPGSDPSTAVPPPNGRRPATRLFFVALEPGATDAQGSELFGATTLGADPSVRGSLARAVARAWVDGTGARWQ